MVLLTFVPSFNKKALGTYDDDHLILGVNGLKTPSNFMSRAI